MSSTETDAEEQGVKVSGLGWKTGEEREVRSRERWISIVAVFGYEGLREKGLSWFEVYCLEKLRKCITGILV